MTVFSTEFASKCLICLAALAYRALLTAGSCWRGWRNGYRWVLSALLVAIFGMRGGADGASFWWFIFSTLGGVGLSGGIICTLFPDWFGGCGVTLSWSGVVLIGGMFTLGNFGASLGGRSGDCVAVSDGIYCSGWTVVC